MIFQSSPILRSSLHSPCVEALNYDEIIAFLEKQNPNPDIVCRFKQAYHTFSETGEWHPAYQVFVTGWQHLTGVMLMEPEKTLDASKSHSRTEPASSYCKVQVSHHIETYRVYLTTTTERSLRELLLAFPRRCIGIFHLTGKWMVDRIHGILEGDVVETDAGTFYRGIKRGSSASAEQRTVSKRKDAIASHVRKLTSLKGRLEHAQFVVEGHLMVERAVVDGLPVDTLLYTTSFVATSEGKALLKQASTENLSYYQVSDGVMGSVTTTRPVPAVVASVYLNYPHFLSESGELNFHFSAGCIVLIAENVGNPDNLGMTLRTADAAGVSAVLLSGAGASPFHKNCIRASRGAVGRLPLFYASDTASSLEALRDADWTLLGATARAEKQLYSTAVNLPTAVVVGNENAGLPAETRELCTELVRIPMAPGQSSLNVGVAAGVLLYEVTRQHRCLSL